MLLIVIKRGVEVGRTRKNESKKTSSVSFLPNTGKCQCLQK
jgi:hypothetical protein